MTTDASRNPPQAPVRPLARRLLWPALATAVVFAVLLTLGSWQVARLTWKLELIERVESRVDAAPVPAPGPAACAAGCPLRGPSGFPRPAVSANFL